MSTTEQQHNLSLLASLVQNVAGVPETDVRPDRVLIDDLGLDSLALVAVVFAIEESTGTAIDEEHLAGVRTVQDLLDLMPAR
jgi:acyl carrier protein